MSGFTSWVAAGFRRYPARLLALNALAAWSLLALPLFLGLGWWGLPVAAVIELVLVGFWLRWTWRRSSAFRRVVRR